MRLRGCKVGDAAEEAVLTERLSSPGHCTEASVRRPHETVVGPWLTTA